MSASYNMPMHRVTHNSDGYSLENSYSQEGITPAGMVWDEQSDGGGKFRLKRRRRCGQCIPCQVKENCNKCQYCLRKDVLKQACVYRKCVHLRKPVPRFRPEPAITGTASDKSTPTPPMKTTSTPLPPPTNSANSNSSCSSSNTNNCAATNNSNMTPVPISSSIPADISSHSAEFSSCRRIHSPFSTLSAMQNISNGVLDPLRHRMIEHPHRSLFDMSIHSNPDHSRNAIEASKPVLADAARFPSMPSAPGLNNHCKLDQGPSVITYANDLNPASVAVASSLSSVNSVLSNHQSYQPNKGHSLPSRDSYLSSMDTWSSMPYTMSHAPTWATQALPNHHAAACGFQQHPTTFPSSFTPSCRLGLPDPAAPQFSSPAGPQHSFHHSMTGFPQDFTHAASSHASMRRPVNPPFYHTPHIQPSGISSFHGLGHFSSTQPSYGPTTYSIHPHSHMYPSGFYSFRTAAEPQIYQVQIYLSENPFRQTPLSFIRENEMKNEHSLLDVSKDFRCNILDILCLTLGSSHVRASKDVVALKHASNYNVNEVTAESGVTHASCIPCCIYFVNGAHKCLDNFKKIMLSQVGHIKKVMLPQVKHSKKVMLPQVKHSKKVMSQVKHRKKVMLSQVKHSKKVMLSQVKHSKKVMLSQARHSKKVMLSHVKHSKKVMLSQVKHSKKVMLSQVKHSKKVMLLHLTNRDVVSFAQGNKTTLEPLVNMPSSSRISGTEVDVFQIILWVVLTSSVTTENHSHCTIMSSITIFCVSLSWHGT